jgi:hypothetical protein
MEAMVPASLKHGKNAEIGRRVATPGVYLYDCNQIETGLELA